LRFYITVPRWIFILLCWSNRVSMIQPICKMKFYNHIRYFCDSFTLYGRRLLFNILKSSSPKMKSKQFSILYSKRKINIMLSWKSHNDLIHLSIIHNSMQLNLFFLSTNKENEMLIQLIKKCISTMYENIFYLDNPLLLIVSFLYVLYLLNILYFVHDIIYMKLVGNTPLTLLCMYTPT
jgi:hypothetical protein